VYGFGDAEVTSAVYEAGPLYLYTYIIDNPDDSSQVVSWFSVDVADGAEITSIGYDLGMNNPALWHEVVSSMDDAILSIDALFIDAIEAGETSTLLYYLSPLAPSKVTARVGGTGGVVEGEVIAPVPEPATLLIVSMGALMLRRRK
jgi:hypothetical protein